MTSREQFPIRSAEEAAALIPHGATLGIGGFTDPGCPHAVPRALAQRAREFYECGKPFQVRILSGAEAGPAVDVDLPQADAVSFRMPFQGEKTCRDAINAAKIDFADVHLSHCSQQLFEGYFGKIDFAVIEASDITDDGKVYFTTAIGNGPTYLRLAEKVVIEINRITRRAFENSAIYSFFLCRLTASPSRSDTPLTGSVRRTLWLIPPRLLPSSKRMKAARVNRRAIPTR